ncbi:hypothetical protein ACFQ73_08560 [Amycolatopsis japonica]|uniref:hypothetical protein n=1 Tax=Amycolatopsis japonica TaxID=208439 RepID=UPI0036723A2D
MTEINVKKTQKIARDRIRTPPAENVGERYDQKWTSRKTEQHWRRSIVIWFGKRRKEKGVRLRLSALADEIGARAGEVLDEEFSGGMGIMGSPISLVIVAIQRGPDDRVTRTVLDAVRAAGYASPHDLPSERRRVHLFPARADLPHLSISFTPAGQRIAYRGEVPEQCVGITFSISA